MTLKHTPGPWQDDGIVSIWANDKIIAQAIKKDDRRLIAAAPDLLLALITLLEISTNLNELDQAQARNAIAKAIGES